MYFKAILLVSCFPTLVHLVSACEGECIVQITKAFLGNYSAPIHSVFRDMVCYTILHILELVLTDRPFLRASRSPRSFCHRLEGLLIL